jgi:hypothetical protein
MSKRQIIFIRNLNLVIIGVNMKLFIQDNINTNHKRDYTTSSKHLKLTYVHTAPQQQW